jgi:hypothetical protein
MFWDMAYFYMKQLVQLLQFALSRKSPGPASPSTGPSLGQAAEAAAPVGTSNSQSNIDAENRAAIQNMTAEEVNTAPQISLA